MMESAAPSVGGAVAELLAGRVPGATGWSLAIALALTACVGILDFLTGYELRLGSLYLLPIALATWNAGRKAGVAMACAACICWVVSFSSTHGYTLPLLFFWDGTVMAATFVVFVFLLARLRRALMRADERFVRLLEEMHAAVYVVDREDGRVLYTNHRLTQMLGIDANGISDSELRQRFTGEDSGSTVANDRGSGIAASAAFRSEEKRDPISGRWFLVQSGPIPWDGAREVDLKVVTDITDRRHAQQLRRENQDMLYRTARLSALAETASALAHDINQPLMAIASYNDACLRLLQTGATNIAELTEALEKARTQAVRASKILRRMREFVRSKRPEPVLCDLNEIINEALELMETRIEEDSVNTEFTRARNLPALRADRFLLVQVVVNLLENAVEAMHSVAPPLRRLAVSTDRQDNGSIVVSIADNGCGIPAAFEDRLGTPFLTTKPNGLGLGLSICRSVVEAHGGHLWHTSNPSGGVTFHFTLAAEAG